MYTNIVYLNNLHASNILTNILNDSVFFDIETTGLSVKTNQIISISALIFDSEKYSMIQYFSESKSDEVLILKQFISLIKNKKYVITYNGNSFDIPFISNKLIKYNINFTIDIFIKIDLLNDIRNLKYKLNITNLKLKTVEYLFNINRTDELTGKDIIKIYKSYLQNNKKVYRDLILQHNFEDVNNLPILFNKIFDLYDFTMLCNYSGIKNIIRYNYNDISFFKNTISIKLIIYKNSNINYVNYNSYYELLLNNEKGIIKIKLKPYYFNDKSVDNLIYLLNEDLNIYDYEKIEEIRNDIIPLKFKNEIYHKNINIIIKRILDLNK